MPDSKSPDLPEVSPGDFEDDLEVAIAALYELGRRRDPKWFSALDISHSLRDDFGLNLHWRTIDSLLGGKSDLVQARRKNGRKHYLLMAAGADLVSAPDQAVALIDPTQTLKSVMSLHDLLSGLEGTVRICDPYLDSSTIEHLDALSDNTSIQLLSQTIRDSGKLRRVLGALRADKTAVSIRKPTSLKLHDRYVIDDGQMFILGTSLNGFGKKQSFVIKAGPDMMETMRREFDKMWSGASQWP